MDERATTTSVLVTAVVSVAAVGSSLFCAVFGLWMGSSFMGASPTAGAVVFSRAMLVVAALLWLVPVAVTWGLLGRRAAGWAAALSVALLVAVAFSVVAIQLQLR